MANITIQMDRGARLRSVLTQARLSKNKVSIDYDISAHTLHAWMCGRRTLSEKGTKRICEILRKEGWYCSPEWLLTGKGMSPTRLDEFTCKETNTFQQAVNVAKHLNEDFAMAKEASFFKISHKNCEVLMIGDDAMNPYYSSGDIVAGICVEPSQFHHLIGRPCIVEVSGMEICIRILHKGSSKISFNLTCTNLSTHASNPVVIDCVPIKIAPIIWHRASLSSILG